MQAASVVKDDARLAFESETPAVDSLRLFNYYQLAYTVFAEDRDGTSVRQALAEMVKYATDSTRHSYAIGEMRWATWDGDNFLHRLAFDSLQTLSNDNPEAARAGLNELIRRVEKHSARLDASYVYAFLSWQQEHYDEALDTMQVLWQEVGTAEALPYEEYAGELLETYSSTLLQRGMQHRRSGASAKAFANLVMVTKLGSQYTAQAFIEALKLVARNNPPEARKLEEQIETVYDGFSLENKRIYLSLMGNVYRRIGEVTTAEVFHQRYKALAR